MPLLSLPTKISKTTPCKERNPLKRKGVAGMDALAGKNILTRRANQRHIFIITNFWQNARGGAPLSSRCAVQLARTSPVHDRLAFPFSLRMRLPLPG
jgi:hypothetical protein